jgi:hypothetical protein
VDAEHLGDNRLGLPLLHSLYGSLPATFQFIRTSDWSAHA